MGSGERRRPGPRVILTPDQRVRVFISSTLEELAAERTAARRAINRLRLLPVYYESGARAHPPRSIYRAYLAQSLVFVGIYWQRYGWVAPGMDISGLEDEYRLADGKPMLLYVKQPAPELEPRLAALIDTIREAGTTSYQTFATPRELERLLAHDLAVLLSETFAGAAAGVAAPPTGEELAGARTLSFLFTNVEDSAGLLRRLGGGDYAAVLADHQRLIREVLAAHDGREVDTQKDAFVAVFGTARGCAVAAIAIQQAIAAHSWPAGEMLRVRIGTHVGEAEQTATGLVGTGVHRGARIAAVAHGGQILVSAAAAALLGDTLPDGASLRDLGWHRLKDLGPPEQIFQLDAPGLVTTFPALKSLDNPRLPNNLPAQASSFIGRDAELSGVSQLVATSRLVTLTGASGSGKTRLALQVAAGLLDGSGDGVWFTDLAPVADAGLVARTVANVLGVLPEAGRSVTDTLAEAIGERSLLVLLDNCEHVIGACAEVSDALLRVCPNLALLATSREPLGIDGERIYRVPTLATPGPDDDLPTILGSEAVRLFADRAAQAGAPLVFDERTAPVIARISRRLDGIPLAIELAAARLRVMSVTDVDARLDQRFSLLTGGSRAAPPRHQTLLATIDWSWDLLTEAERDMLARLSVFAGGFDLAACEAVTAGAGIMVGEVVDLLAALVDKSLVQFDEVGGVSARYRLLETVRQFAAQRLHERGGGADDAAGARHRDHYLALAESAAPKLIASDQAVWLDRLDAELGNLRAAIAFSQRHADPEPGLRLAASLRIFWSARGHAAEAVDSLRALLDLPALKEPGAARAQALATAATLVEQPAAADAYSAEAMRIAETIGDAHLVADIVATRALCLIRAGQNAAALPLVENALGLAHRLGDRHLTARLLYDRSDALDSEGDHAAAARDATESLDLFRQLGDLRETGRVLSNLAYDEAGAGKLEPARAHLAESLTIHRRLKDKHGVVYASLNLGIAEYLSGSPAAAASLFAESLQLARRLFLSEGVGYALLGLAMIRDGPEAADRSARLHGAADKALDTLGRTPQPLETQLRDADQERLRAAMGAQAFEAGYAAGRALSSEEAIELALRGNSPVGSQASDALAAKFSLTLAESVPGSAGNTQPWLSRPTLANYARFPQQCALN